MVLEDTLFSENVKDRLKQKRNFDNFILRLNKKNFQRKKHFWYTDNFG